MSFIDFHFLRPYWFLGLLPLSLLWLWMRRYRQSARSWAGICDAQLLPHLLVTYGSERHNWASVVIVATGMLGVVALAGPVWERVPQPVFQRRSALVIALDLSASMGAEDVKPNRLVRARFKIADLLKRRTEGQTALVVFAERAFTVTPLTDDTQTILNQLPVLAPEIMPSQGSRPDRAVELGVQLLRQASAGAGDLLLLTDGIDPSAVEAFKHAVAAQRSRVSILGVATPGGAPIPLRDGGFVKGAAGEIVMAGLNEPLFHDVARSSGGLFQPIAAGDDDVDAFTALLQTQPAVTDLQRMEFQTDRWYEQGPWLVLLGLALALTGFRRGYLVLAVLICSMNVQPGYAADWQSWWWRPDQQGVQALKHGDAATAEQLFSDPRWRGAAQYRQGNYSAASKSWDSDQSAEGLYNKGNALAKTEKYQEAAQAYEAALALDPKLEDARYNLDIVKKRMESPTPPPDGNNSDKSQQDNERAKKNDNSNSGAGSNSDGERQQQSQQADGARPGDAGGKQGKPDDNRAPKSREKNPQAEQNLGKPEEGTAPKAQASRPMTEAEQANEQWLRRVPDDPGGLLRRKFYYQYRQQENLHGGGQGW